MAIKIIRNIPAAELDATKQMFIAAGATDIDTLSENDGQFTLIVTYPDRETFHQLQQRLNS